MWTYAKTIGELEGLDADTQFILEVAAITHDIACPLCRKKYGNTNGKYQEQEGAPLVREFLADTGMTAEQIDRVAYLVGHHHSPAQIDGIDYQILIEADYIVNASESGYGQQAIRTSVSYTHLCQRDSLPDAGSTLLRVHRRRVERTNRSRFPEAAS